QVVPHADNGRITAVKLHKGVLHATTKLKESKTYTFKNRSEQERVVILEHPFRAPFQLTSPEKPIETASDVYRFQLSVPAGKAVSQTVAEEREVGSQVVLTNSDDQSIRVFLNAPATNPAMKEALRKALELKGKLALTQREVQAVQRELTAIKQ